MHDITALLGTVDAWCYSIIGNVDAWCHRFIFNRRCM